MKDCQLCGSTEDVCFIDTEFLPIVHKICEIEADESLKTCMECNIFLYQIQVFIRKVQLVSSKLHEPTKAEVEIASNAEANPVPDNSETSKDFSYMEEIYEEEEIYDDEDFESEQLGSSRTVEASDSPKQQNDDEKNEDEKLFSFKCHVCEAPEFTKMFQLSAHTRSKHKCLPLVKCFCDKQLSTMRGLQRHRAKHFPRSTDLRCSECGRNFKTQKGLENHFEKWHGPNKETFICSQCGRNFCNAKVLERHEITHELPPELRRKYECADCKKCFISSEARKCHYAKHHEKILSFFCDVCSKGFYTRKSLNSHTETHKPNESVVCDLCNGTFKTLKYMQKHRRTHFLPPQSSFLECDICRKQFRKKTQLKMHMLVHSDVAEHSCKICLRSFKKKAYLKTHMVTHTGEKKYRCMFCDRLFADSGNCRKHKLRDHPDEIEAFEAKYGKKGISNALYLDMQS